ncbi:uncharacterized protein LOC134253928 [Saccostrea cucullata]|uniref:uncharacterized protein LOC134253928 n=1 Tax=Saccostrea cuccullata TaxID=36930 RepID=UPI002ED43A2A
MADIKVIILVFLAHFSVICASSIGEDVKEIFQKLDELSRKVSTLESKNSLLQEELNRQNGSFQEFKTKHVQEYSDLSKNHHRLVGEFKILKFKDFEPIKKRADLQDEKIKKLESLQSTVNSLSTKLGEAPPSFYAMMTSTVQIQGSNQTIIYDKTGTNNGNAYNTSTGIFTVPETGTYVFTWTAFSYVEEYVRLEIVVAGTIYGGTLSDTQETSDADTETAIVVVNANTGDEVYIRSQSEDPGDGHLYVEHECSSTFSGWKIS